ncbi:MAG: hypothetical protein CMH61_00460 [Nanoarchaeota archaeon]|nr:hypothetical protein [Nanoarchaeota archaeon]
MVQCISVSSFNTIHGNNISTDGYIWNFGIFLSENSTNNTISQNVITTSGSQSDGISINYTVGTDPSNNVTNNSFEDVSGYDLAFHSPGLNETKLVNQPISNYSFNSTKIYFERSTLGIVKFLDFINGTGTNLSNDIRIENNSIVVESGNNSGLNKPANLTLYGVPTNYTDPVILKDYAECAAPACYNYTSLNAGTVLFNVTSFSNYSIGEKPPAAPAEESSSSSSSGGGGGGGGGSSSTISVEKKFTSAKPGESTTVSFTKDAGVIDITFDVNTEISRMTVSVQSVPVTDKAVAAVSTPSGNSYKYLKMTAGTDQKNINSAKINFKVATTWFTQNRYDRKSVVLQRHADKWKRLPTTQLRSDLDFVYYEAETPGFSLFVITAEELPEGVTARVNEAGELVEQVEVMDVPAAVEEVIEQPVQEVDNSKLIIFSMVGLLIIIILVWLFKKRSTRKTS